MRTSTLNVCLRFLRPTGGVIAPPHFNMSDGRRDCSRANSRSPSSRISRRAHSAAKWVCVVPSTYTRSPQAKSTLRYWGQQVWVVHSFSGDSFPDGSALSFIPTPPPRPHTLYGGGAGVSRAVNTPRLAPLEEGLAPCQTHTQGNISWDFYRKFARKCPQNRIFSLATFKRSQKHTLYIILSRTYLHENFDLGGEMPDRDYSGGEPNLVEGGGGGAPPEAPDPT